MHRSNPSHFFFGEECGMVFTFLFRHWARVLVTDDSEGTKRVKQSQTAQDMKNSTRLACAYYKDKQISWREI